jgi:Holliday junction resolvase
MIYRDDYIHVVAIKEMSAGNESVGTMWMETKIFLRTEPVENIIKWAKDSGGKLIITVAEE